MRTLSPVIKLKQIDHVRHEREILRDVSGHPFITNLLASFSDREFLYLLVSNPSWRDGPDISGSNWQGLTATALCL